MWESHITGVCSNVFAIYLNFLNFELGFCKTNVYEKNNPKLGVLCFNREIRCFYPIYWKIFLFIEIQKTKSKNLVLNPKFVNILKNIPSLGFSATKLWEILSLYLNKNSNLLYKN